MNNIDILKTVPVIITLNNIITKKHNKVTDDLIRDDINKLSPILLHINTIGGDLPVAYSIISVMKILQSDVYTFVSGEAMSAGALILMSGKKGFRFADKNANVMIHYPIPFQGMNEAVDSFIQRGNKENKKIENFISSVTGQTKSVVKEHLKNETTFTAKEALRFGMIDKII